MPLHPHSKTQRRLVVFVSALTASAAVASGASAMPRRDAAPPHVKTTHHQIVLNPARIDAAAHAATMRALGARIAGACS